MALYFALLGYVVVVAMVSITRQVFAPPSREAVDELASLECDEGATRLSEELRHHATGRVEGSVLPPDDAFFERWDRTYQVLAARCHSEPSRALSRLRYKTEITLRRFDREEGRVFTRFARGTGATSRTEP